MLLDVGVMRSKCRNMEVWCRVGLIRRFGVLLLLPLLLQVMRNWRSRGEVLWSREGERERDGKCISSNDRFKWEKKKRVLQTNKTSAICVDMRIEPLKAI